MRILRDGRRMQSGATLVEVLVSLVIASLALALIVGTLSTGLLDSTIAKRNTAGQGVLQYEMEAVNASQFSASAANYSDCFATESSTSPMPAATFQAACPSGPYTLRADVSWQWKQTGVIQLWTVTIVAWPADSTTGSSIQFYKIDR
jgi:type II secretory pathway pseudopilin PulG